MVENMVGLFSIIICNIHHSLLHLQINNIISPRNELKMEKIERESRELGRIK